MLSYWPLVVNCETVVLSADWEIGRNHEWTLMDEALREQMGESLWVVFNRR